MPTLLVHTNFCDGLRLKWWYLRNHTSDRHDKHIDTRSIHCASDHKKRDEKALQTSEIHGTTGRRASCRLSETKCDRSRSVEQLRSLFFLESMRFFFLVTSSIESKAMRVTIRIGYGFSLHDAGPRPRIDRKASAFP